ncbi:MAG: chromate efflux transporter [Anaerolineales bacterium]
MNSVSEAGIPRESHLKLFLRFLRFGLLAWGGPVAQIALLRQELVDEERWVSNERFNRVLAVYQVLPGPEAHEMCVYFGMLARGRWGGVLAGLGFMLPGFALMFALSWFYVTYGLASPLFVAVFYGFKPAVAALIVRAVHRIGQHALTDHWLWAIAIGAFAAQWLGVNFLITLALAGVLYALVKRTVALNVMAAMMIWPLAASAAAPSALELLGYGLRAGLLTFGGAYTAIPILQYDAVAVGGWMTNAQFLDGLALGGILPAPLIIFSTFVGYLGGGPWGALTITTGVFLPAFAFTLIGHEVVERLIENTTAHAFLDGVTAAVVGLIAATAIGLLREAIPDVPAALIFGLALVTLYRWKAKAAVAGVMLGAGLLGLLLFAPLG